MFIIAYEVRSYYRALSETHQASKEPVYLAAKYVIMEMKKLSPDVCLIFTLFHKNYECLV